MPININKVKALVSDNLSHARSVKEVALYLGVPVESLRKDFRRQEHEPLSNYLIRERLKEMQKLLINSDLRCYEICFHLGLRDDSGQKFFRRNAGMAMEEFRSLSKRHKKENKKNT
jgi:transcriptional regulator GlxA family with amidase domain